MQKEIKNRLIIPLQTKANLGKSMVCTGSGQWLTHHEFSWHGFDLDPDHQTFSRTLPDDVKLWPISEEAEDDFIKLLRKAIALPIAVIDIRAHMSRVLLRSMGLIRFTQTFADVGGRITVLLFPMDDLEAMTDLDYTVTTLGDTVDWIVVRNPSRIPRTRMYDGSELETELNRLGAATLEVPTLLSLARNHLAAVEAQLGRGLSHVEAVANRELSIDPMVRMITEDWLKTLFRRFDHLARLLLPTGMAAGIAQVDAPSFVNTSVCRGAKINPNQL